MCTENLPSCPMFAIHVMFRSFGNESNPRISKSMPRFNSRVAVGGGGVEMRKHYRFAPSRLFLLLLTFSPKRKAIIIVGGGAAATCVIHQLTQMRFQNQNENPIRRHRRSTDRRGDGPHSISALYAHGTRTSSVRPVTDGRARAEHGKIQFHCDN